MLDSLGRKIDYMRISITDRCNLRCSYCMPADGIDPLTHEDILRYEDILRICRTAVKLGIRNFKVTGGEPLVRKGVMNFLRELKSILGVEHVTLTTNGVLLEQFVDEMADMGLDGINLSLDGLNPDTYMSITGRDQFQQVFRSFKKAVEAGLRVKINCVPILGLNDSEIINMAQISETIPVDVRFIEFMPARSVGSHKGITGPEILDKLSARYPDLTLDPRRRGFGPARYYKSSKLLGSIGIIDPIGGCFCDRCNRIRLTSDGFLKLCLFYEDGLDLHTLIKNGVNDREMEDAFKAAVLRKPEKHFFDNKDVYNIYDSHLNANHLNANYLNDNYLGHNYFNHGKIKNMSQIGG